MAARPWFHFVGPGDVRAALFAVLGPVGAVVGLAMHRWWAAAGLAIVSIVEGVTTYHNIVDMRARLREGRAVR